MQICHDHCFFLCFVSGLMGLRASFFYWRVWSNKVIAYFVHFGILVWIKQPDAGGIWGIVSRPSDRPNELGIVKSSEIRCVLVHATVLNTGFRCWNLLSLKQCQRSVYLGDIPTISTSKYVSCFLKYSNFDFLKFGRKAEWILLCAVVVVCFFFSISGVLFH